MHALNPNPMKGDPLATPVKRSGVYQKRRSGAIRQLVGFTTKPRSSAKSDGIRRARMIDSVTGAETRVRVDQFGKTYEYVY